MRRVKNLAVPLAVVTATAFLSIGPAPGAQAAAGGTLYVDNSSTSHCSDSTADSSAAPYCTIQAAVDAAQPGDTVQVKPGDTFSAETDITTSGEAGEPITIDGGYVPGVSAGAVISTHSSYGFDVNGAQYIDLKGFVVQDAATDDVYLNGASNVTVSGMQFNYGSVSTYAGLYMQSSSYSTVETSQFFGRFQWAVGIGGIATTDTVTTNAFFNSEDGIEDTAVPDTAITSNTLEHLCGQGIEVSAGEAGLATGSTIENNVLSDFSCGSLGILGDSEEVTADYNVIYANKADSQDYYWLSGTDNSVVGNYTSPAQICAAVGQGCHDLDTDPALNLSMDEGQISSDSSSAIDSANADAPGELSTDLLGRPRVDDPNVANTGVGVQSYYDRGAYEYEDPFAGSSIGVTAIPTGAFSVANAFMLSAKPWGALSYSIDYGDGTTPVTYSNLTQPVPTHQYAKLGAYPITVTATDASGGKATGTATFTTAGSEFTAYGPARLLDTRDGTGGISGKIVSGRTVSLKIDGVGSLPASGITAVALNVTATDGTGPGYVSASSGTSLVNFGWDETIANSAIVPVIDGAVQLTVTGITSSQATDLVVDVTGYFTGSTASGYTSLYPTRLLDTRNGTGGSTGKVAGGKHIVLTVAGAGKGILPASGLTAVALNLTATDGTGGGFVTAYPDGTATPISSNLNYSRSETIAAAAIVPVGKDGKIDLYVGGPATQSVDLVADVTGYYSPTSAAAYVPIVPNRVIDTRGSGGPLHNDATVTFDPANVDAVQAVLPGGALDDTYTLPRDAEGFDFNLTVTQTTGSGLITAYPYESQSTPIPGVSNLNYAPGETVANFAQASSGPSSFDGSVDVSPNGATGTVQLIADLCGLYATS